MNFIDGEILYVDKPLEWTSFNVVKRIRSILLRRMHTKKLKVGHAGTLDPLATGVMIICTGKATKHIDTLQAGVKEYIATIALGATTPSYDLETPIDATYPTEHITEELVRETLEKFKGRIEQVTPPSPPAKSTDTALTKWPVAAKRSISNPKSSSLMRSSYSTIRSSRSLSA